MNLIRAVTPKYTGRIWPTGKFGVSRVRETPFPSLVKSQPETDESQWQKNLCKVHGAEAVLRFQGKWERVMRPDLSNVPKSPISKKRGLKGITRYGRNLISSAAVVQEQRYGKALLSFGTVTLPALERESLLAVSQNWSQIVKQFVKNLRRGLTSKGLPSSVFGVTEIQQKRFESYGLPALHLHFVFVGRNSKKSSWQINRKNIRRWWKLALKPFVPSDTDFSSVENVQGIKKSAAAYLGKYMSKGAGDIEKLTEQGFEEWIPSAWYTITHDLRRKVLALVLRGEQVGEFLDWLCHNPLIGTMSWVMPVLIKNKAGFEYSIGFAGSLTQRGLDMVSHLRL